MAKAVTEIAIGAAAIGAAFLLPGVGVALSATMFSSLLSMGGSMALSGILSGVSELTGNQGGIQEAANNPIGAWNYVYGVQKVGGIKVFDESNNNTGVSGSASNWKQSHRVYILACHPSHVGNWQLRCDGKQVLMTPSGNGYQSYSPTQLQPNITSVSRANGVVTIHLSSGLPNYNGLPALITNVADNTFNGTWVLSQPNPADNTTFQYTCGGNDITTSGGKCKTTYPDYKDKIHVEWVNGHHTSTFPTLLAAGSSWNANDRLLGRTAVYVQMGYDDTIFPNGHPNVSFLFDGKDDILDPRTGTRGFSNNAALCVADYLSLPTQAGGFGLAIGSDIPTAQLISAANTCDESVNLAGGGTIKRYTCDLFFQLNRGRGSILQDMLTSCAGRLSYQGGTYSIFPGVWVAPTLSLTDGDMIGDITFRPRMSIRDTANAVKGTYVSPENDYQQGDFPAYMQDPAHGYASDVWLAEDRGERIFKEANFPCTSNSATAQRLAKIELLRTRNQLRGTIHCNLKAYQLVALDTFTLTHARYNWTNKLFEVLSSRFVMDKSGDVPTLAVELDIAEVASTIYDWSSIEQLTPQGWKEPANARLSIVSPPENVQDYSGPGATILLTTFPSTITTGANGEVQNSIYVCWTSPNDPHVTSGGHIEVQWSADNESTWSSLGKFDSTATSCFIPNVSDGAPYWVRVRAVSVAGVPSDWVMANPTPVVVSVTQSGTVAPPTNLALEDDTSTAIVMGDGTSMSRLLVTWTPPADSYVPASGQIQVQYMFSTTGTQPSPLLRPIGGPILWQSAWVNAGTVSGNATFLYIDGIASYQSVTVRARSIRANGATSNWATISTAHYIIRANPVLGGGNSILKYADGTTIETWQPAQKGADVTGSNTAANTSYVGARVASDVVNTVQSGGGINFGSGLHSNKTLDYIPNGSSNFAVKAIDGNGKALIDFSQGHSNKNIDNIVDGSSYARVSVAHVSAGGVLRYTSGTLIDSLRPAQAAADVTGSNTAANTSNVGARSSSDVVNTVQPGGGIDFSSGLHLNSGLVRNNLLDPSWWSIGAGIPWGRNIGSGTVFDSLVTATFPDGSSRIAWQANSGPSDGGTGGGGWNPGGAGNSFSIDPTKTYMFVCYQRHIAGGGAGYWGVQNGAVCGLNTTSSFDNPYFVGGFTAPVNGRWYLCIGWVYPYGSTGMSSAQAGVWDCTTGQQVGGGTNYNWMINPGAIGTRAYQYYANSGIHQFAMPGVYLCDGREPSLDTLLAFASPSARNPISGSNYSKFINAGAIPLDHISDTGNYSRVPTSVYGPSGRAVDTNGNLKLKNTKANSGVTANPSVNTSTFADLPELGSGNGAMTIALAGNPVLIGANLNFYGATGSGSSGPVIGIGTTFTAPTGQLSVSQGPPNVAISISGNGTGAGAGVSWAFTQQGVGPGPSYIPYGYFTPSLSISGGQGYTNATATVTITNGSSPYSNGTNNYSCSIGASTPQSGVPIQARILMDGVPVVGPVQVTTDSKGYASLTFPLTLQFPSQTSHWFQVQAWNLNGTYTVTSTFRQFQLVELG